MLIQSVPNFSEGRRKEVINELVLLFQESQVSLIDYSMDEDHNRSVFTLLGEPGPLKEAILKGVKKARDLIDMREHQGSHPRIGATDVIPFIPVSDATMADCIGMAKEVAQEIFLRYDIPTYLYGQAASSQKRENLSSIRKGEFEGLKEVIEKGKRPPDFGTSIHDTAGATAVGARMPLIAFNVHLNTSDPNIGRAIASSIRESSGGLVNIKAMGLTIEESQKIQISMNVENYQKTPLYRVQELIKIEARRYGVSITDSQIIGLIPMEALVESGAYYLQIKGLTRHQILENHLLGRC